jgi:single-strand DNA-binding protein
MNVVVLRGALSSAPVERSLPSGAIVWSLEVTCPADDGSGPVSSVPVSWIDPPLRTPLSAGDEIVVVGHVRRRFFRVGGATQSRTEVVAAEVVPARQARRAERVVTRAAQLLGAAT